MAKSPLMVLPEFLDLATNLPKELKSKLVRILWLLSQDVMHPSLQTRKVRSAKADVYECRVDQDVRLLYDMKDGALRCWYVGSHDRALDVAAPVVGRASRGPVEDIQVRQLSGAIGAIARYLHFGEAANFEATDVDVLANQIGVNSTG